jgi:hypothetical protein
MFLFLNDYGVAIDLDVIGADCLPHDLTPATTVEYEFRKPDGTIVTKTATKINSPGLDGKLRYLVEAGLLNVVGTWSYRGKITIPSGVYRTEQVQFSVKN